MLTSNSFSGTLFLIRFRVFASQEICACSRLAYLIINIFLARKVDR